MPNKNPVITVTTQPEDGAVQVEVALRAGLDAAVSRGIARESIVTASTFTTISATAILEQRAICGAAIAWSFSVA